MSNPRFKGRRLYLLWRGHCRISGQRSACRGRWRIGALNSICHNIKVKVKFTQLCPTLCDPMDCSPPDSSVLGILQARILEWVVLSSSRGFSWPRDQLHLLYCRILYSWATGGSLFYRVGQSWNSKQSSWNEITKCFMVTSQSQSLCPSLGLFPIHLLPCLPPTFPVQIRCS